MRKSMLVVALALCMSFGAFAQHTPVLDAASCPATADEFGNPITWIFVPLPQFNIMTMGGPVNFAPCAGQYDFCAYADIVFCSLGPIASLLPEVADFAFLIQCLNMDINGPIDPLAAIPVTGNGIPDGQYELGVLAGVLNDVSEPLNAAATVAYQDYYVNIYHLVQDALYVANLKSDKDLRGVVQAAAPYLVSALVGLLAGMATLGDDTTNTALDELLGLLSAIGLTPPEGGIGSLGTPVPALGPDGDADGDLFTNRQEYNYCQATSACSGVDFVVAALDPLNVPDIVLPVITLDGWAPRINVGTDVAITANFNLSPLSYVWKKEGVVIADATGATLAIPNAQAADSGNYSISIAYDDGMKAPATATKSFVLDIGDYPIPVAGLLGLSLLAGACAAAGVAGIRRRK